MSPKVTSRYLHIVDGQSIRKSILVLRRYIHLIFFILPLTTLQRDCLIIFEPLSKRHGLSCIFDFQCRKLLVR